MKPTISIAMATHTDFYGVFSTVQALRMYHDLTDCEIIVLDNASDNQHGRDTRQFIENIQGTGVPISYHTLEGDTGTSRTRHHLFELAKGELVVVVVVGTQPQVTQTTTLPGAHATSGPVEHPHCRI
jgi:hypothetical protein